MALVGKTEPCEGESLSPTHSEVIEFLAANGIAAPLFPRIDAEDDLSWAVPEMWRGDEEEREVALRMRAKYAAPALPDGMPPCRGDEVRAWLDCVMPDAVPTDWLLLDDENDYWPSQIDRLVLCDPFRGFDEEALNRALALISC